MASPSDQEETGPAPASLASRWWFSRRSASKRDDRREDTDTSSGEPEKNTTQPTKWSLGVLNDSSTHEVPGSVLLLSGQRNQPLGLRNAPARASHSSLPPQPFTTIQNDHEPLPEELPEGKKTTPDGAVILNPQPDESQNDPLNWPKWRRDASLLSLGLYCMIGGGMTTILAAGFTNVAETYDVTVPQVALTTGLYMMGLGVGSIIACPTAILFGKRPVYLASALVFVLSSVWCALSPTYSSLIIARVVMGLSVSSVECLPSATVAEIFFLHERAYRIGIYTLLLLGGKNLVPLVSAVIIQSLGWRWVFWIVAMYVGFCGMLLFVFVPESFWDRTPRPKKHKISGNTSKSSLFRSKAASQALSGEHTVIDGKPGEINDESSPAASSAGAALPQRPPVVQRATSRSLRFDMGHQARFTSDLEKQADGPTEGLPESEVSEMGQNNTASLDQTKGEHSNPDISGSRLEGEATSSGLQPAHTEAYDFQQEAGTGRPPTGRTDSYADGMAIGTFEPPLISQRYTNTMRSRPALTFVQQMKPYNGRFSNENWLRVAVRPFILFAYPAVLWSAGVYGCAVGWLIVLSESVAEIYRSPDTYDFHALATGLVYLSPFIGGILGTCVAGKVSDIVVKAMAKRNGGLYEPEFRLVMAAPVALTTVVGLMGFGWSAQNHDHWIVPTVFFGITSFGCTLGSTTAITFCVDSYRQYAGEALVTLNITKNILHGLVFSLFFNNWLEKDGSRTVFIWLGVIQLVLMAFTIPMYIFGKRARMWTVRKGLMEKF
ncbi:MFS general substrate transporter [Venustampulla echinocandica]|uniref:MFS general substrate transporter n=1 Tax=Venustampulla echinocandica TaxID=2656787 RepID=A0A370TBI4_9HELO|nr:MFS general substrate transporter [Venustampulla echinocandica]RDL31418.1 MFS general substrate transporter [Venustampulla echinocandica]